MDTLSHFHSLDELIRALDRERKLLGGLFQDRKRLSFRYDVARDMAAKKDESLKFLRRFGVIRENGDFVELEDVYMKFFEEVLEVNEEINVASVKESIGNLNAAIDYYQSENSPHTQVRIPEGREAHPAQYSSYHIKKRYRLKAKHRQYIQERTYLRSKEEETGEP